MSVIIICTIIVLLVISVLSLLIALEFMTATETSYFKNLMVAFFTISAFVFATSTVAYYLRMKSFSNNYIDIFRLIITIPEAVIMFLIWHFIKTKK